MATPGLSRTLRSNSTAALKRTGSFLLGGVVKRLGGSMVVYMIYIYIHFWLVVWNMNFIFPYLGNNNPNWLICFRGFETTSQM